MINSELKDINVLFEEISEETSSLIKGGDSTGYIVVPGDTLSTIAGLLCSSPENWPVIAAENRLSDPNSIQPGQKLYIPKPC